MHPLVWLLATAIVVIGGCAGFFLPAWALIVITIGATLLAFSAWASLDGLGILGMLLAPGALVLSIGLGLIVIPAWVVWIVRMCLDTEFWHALSKIFLS